MEEKIVIAIKEIKERQQIVRIVDVAGFLGMKSSVVEDLIKKLIKQGCLTSPFEGIVDFKKCNCKKCKGECFNK